MKKVYSARVEFVVDVCFVADDESSDHDLKRQAKKYALEQIHDFPMDERVRLAGDGSYAEIWLSDEDDCSPFGTRLSTSEAVAKWGWADD